MKKMLSCLVLSLTLLGCAVLHKVQIGEIDNRGKLAPFEIKVSETGVDLNEARNIQRGLFNTKDGNKVGNALAIVGLFQMGPRTGNVVFNEDYAVNLYKALHDQCPGGEVTGITAIREMRKYPVISGEIVKIKGYCLTKGES